MRNLQILTAVFGLILLFGCASGDDDDDDASDDDADDDAGDGGFSLTSSAFEDGGEIPVDYTCDNADYDAGISPPLVWNEIPEGTMYFALTVLDSDADNTAHWGVFDIPADVSEFDEGMRPDGNLPGNSWEALSYLGTAGYAGPCPPAGDDPHHYVFTLYALDNSMPEFIETPDIADMMDLVQDRLIESTEFTGVFRH